MFKFNFDIHDDDSGDKDAISKKDDTNSDRPQDSVSVPLQLQCYEAEETYPTKIHFENLNLFKDNSNILITGNRKIYYIKSGNLLKSLKVTDISEAESAHSDLLPGIYEGGAKKWECTDDLLQYLCNNYPLNYFQDKLVLDLGCGSGLLGIYAMNLGAKVHFQDYNKDVLDNITIPNALINVNETQQNPPYMKFFAGDWSEYTKLTKNNEKFDIILTSETIYNVKNQKKLLDTLDMKLKSDGIILLAAKVYYFGVGGGTRQFEELIKNDKRFESKVIWTCNNEICREILEIQRNQNY